MKCTSCGYDGKRTELGLRDGPRCKGDCAWGDTLPLGPPEYEFGDVVRWMGQEAVVVQQVVRGGAVVVAVEAKAKFALADELEMVQPHA